MKANAESLLRELRKYQKSVEVYEKDRLKMIDKEHRSLGLTDAVVQKELKALGVDFKTGAERRIKVPLIRVKYL